jgi:5-methylcytosine-specific restriction endonuclease McrA
MGTWPELYNTKRWKLMRARQLAAEPCCRICAQKGLAVPAVVVDHRTPHKGDKKLFFDANNLQSLCKEHHNSDKRFQDQRGYSCAVGPDGWPLDPRHFCYTGKV